MPYKYVAKCYNQNTIFVFANIKNTKYKKLYLGK